jgi:hypothetical protein
MWQTFEPERGLVKLDRLSAEEKRHRIQLLSSLLAEYESCAGADAPEVGAVRADLLNRLGRLYFILGDFAKTFEYWKRN